MKTAKVGRRKMIMIARPRIDSAKLIEEVKTRPCVYDPKSGHGNHELKNAAWGEIGAAIYNYDWNQASIAEKDKYVRELQVKWRSLRDNFTRQLRIQEEVKAGMRPQSAKKYIFMDALSFLLPYVCKREKYMYTNTSEDDASIADTIDTSASMYFSEDTKQEVSSQEDEPETVEMSPPRPAITPQPQVQLIPIRPKPVSEASFASGTTHIIDLNSLRSSPLKFPAATSDQDKPLKRMASCMEEMIQLQKEEKTDDAMGNKKFLLSLLPFMKKLPDDVNLEVRLQLMGVLETYNRAMQSN